MNIILVMQEVNMSPSPRPTPKPSALAKAIHKS